jgi:5-methylcytosine-specific restriction protein A
VTAVTVTTKRLVWERADGCCERCGTSAGNDYSYHHRRPRGMGGSKLDALRTPCNIVLLCGSGTTGCHGRVESQRTMALEEGWLVSQSVSEPGTVPLLRLGELVLLDRDGCVSAL